jgi:hypothetical protein
LFCFCFFFFSFLFSKGNFSSASDAYSNVIEHFSFVREIAKSRNQWKQGQEMGGTMNTFRLLWMVLGED